MATHIPTFVRSRLTALVFALLCMTLVGMNVVAPTTPQRANAATGAHRLYLPQIHKPILPRLAFVEFLENRTVYFAISPDGSGRVPLFDSDQSWQGLARWSPDGRTVAVVRTFASGDTWTTSLYVMDVATHTFTRLTDATLEVSDPAVWSWDGGELVFMARAPRTTNHPDLYTIGADGSGLTRLTNDANARLFPAWSPDGKHIAFVAFGTDGASLRLMNADGTGQRSLHSNPGVVIDPIWSPDGQWLAFATDAVNGGYILNLIHPDGTGLKQFAEKIDCDSGSWSPDGRWIAATDIRGALVAFSATGEATRVLVPAASAMYPVWSPDGTLIAYTTRDEAEPDLYVIRLVGADGTGLRTLTRGYAPVWLP